jgi:hypothetical protein
MYSRAHTTECLGEQTRGGACDARLRGRGLLQARCRV